METAARKHVSLRELKFCDLLVTGDIVEFTYKKHTYTARVTVDGLLEAQDLAIVTRATRIRGGKPLYDKPSLWTNDCVATYQHDNPSEKDVKTNASGYVRSRVRRSGKTLNELRDEYVRVFGIDGLTKPATPAEVAALTACSSNVMGDAAHATSIVQLRANGTLGYRDVALILQKELQQAQQDTETVRAEACAVVRALVEREKDSLDRGRQFLIAQEIPRKHPAPLSPSLPAQRPRTLPSLPSSSATTPLSEVVYSGLRGKRIRVK